MEIDPRFKLAITIKELIGGSLELGKHIHLYDSIGNELYEGDIVKTIPYNSEDIIRYNKILYTTNTLNNGMFSPWGWYFKSLHTNEVLEIFGITKFGFNKNLKYFRMEKKL